MTLQARYTILRKVADGGTAEIFLATQHGAHRFEKLVILKRIFPAFYADPQFRDMLIDEAHIAMSLNHSNIVHVLDLGEADGQYVLALELVDGWSLDAILRRARALKTSVPPPLALYMTAEVCRALAYAHAKVDADGNPLGIVHRDISPHNVLLSEQGEVKLTDFGIAKAHNRRESSLGNIIKGKIAYMSPEQASGATIDARSDLFSVGTMLYVMVCRQYPFDAPTDLEVLLMVKSGVYEPPEKAMPGLNPELYRVMKRALSKAPDERYQRAEEMLVDVEQVMRVAFRAVGQTELKRWLQDLSMRDGGVPLTRIPPPPGSASGGRLNGETLELKGVGTTSAHIPTVSLPPPVASRPGGTIPAGTGATQVGKPRPPPPTAALNVGKNVSKYVGNKVGGTAAMSGTSSSASASSPLAAFLARSGSPAEPVREADDPSSFEEAVELTPTPEPADALHERQGASHGLPVGTPHPARIDAKSEPIHSARPTDSTAAADDKFEAAATELSPRRSDSFDLPPSTPRKSSSWVAEAVLAAAQRAGTTPPPPIAGNVVPPPPVSGDIAISPSPTRTVTTQAPESDSAPIPVPPRRALFVGAGLSIVAVLVIGLSARRCGGGTTQAERELAAPPVTATSKPAAAPTAPAPKPAAAAAAPSAAPAAATTVTEPEAPAAAPAGSPPQQEGARPPEPTASLGAIGPSKETAAPSDTVPPAADNSRASPQVVGATPPPTASPAPGTGGATAAAPEPPRLPSLGSTADNSSPRPPPTEVKGAIGAEGAAENAPVGSDRDGDAINSASPVEKTMVLLSSNPPGAQVSTARHQFGATPVSIRLKVGASYALVFTREGYHPVTKHFRVTKLPDQEVVAVLRRDPSAQAVQSNVPAATPSAVKPERNWLQRMFAR